MNVNFKGYLHFNNNKKTIYELKRYLKILFLKALKYTVIKFCPTVAESLLASGQPISRQRKVLFFSLMRYSVFNRAESQTNLTAFQRKSYLVYDNPHIYL